MRLRESEAVVMFLALFALYSPPSSVASYIPLVKPFNPDERRRLATGLFVKRGDDLGGCPVVRGGATVGLLIGFRAEAHGLVAVAMLTGAALGYAAVTGISMYVAGRIEPRLSERGRELFDRLAGILLTAIAFTLLASGLTRLITDVLHNRRVF